MSIKMKMKINAAVFALATLVMSGHELMFALGIADGAL